ncbi:hypothetical protein PsorP6_000760 [Peronosclerospora sorghi]|uniref:Uncharacterized protein n=1 Tax=Peronosclerospora sorghi TaxID=230839 RepID=A0ACC0WZ66_9STRA|nr:hypothetical protein PsorP6_000760 [Peronosclerospora sorghi]
MDEPTKELEVPVVEERPVLSQPENLHRPIHPSQKSIACRPFPSSITRRHSPRFICLILTSSPPGQCTNGA